MGPVAALVRLLQSFRRLSPETTPHSTPGASSATGAETERRQGVRYPCHPVKATCEYALGRLGTHWWPSQVRDVSATGIGLLQERTAPVGATLMVELAYPERTFYRRYLARVVHAAPQAEGWLVGCRFLYPLSPEDLHALIE